MRETIRTERLTLRPLRRADERAWLAAFNDFSHVQWLSAPPFPYTPADFAAFLAEAPARALWVIEDAQGLCGSVALNPHLGYWVLPRAQGRGYATEAARAVLAAHFAHPESGPVKSGYFEGNIASARVLTRLGFAEIARGPEPCRPRGRDLAHVTMTLHRTSWALANPFVLATPRLSLTPVTEADAPAIRRIVTDPRVGPMLFVFAPTLTEAEALDFARSWRWHGTPPFRLALRRDGAFIGAMGLKSLDDPEIYYFLAPEVHGQGLMSEALPAFIAAITDRFALAQLTARVFIDNPASARLLARNGFRPGAITLVASAARAAPAPARNFTRP
ncbi:MAG: GNAT family N-acetyltransferase [Rhodobacteraceae bacterium]|nr:GNAT family N-acetyltransferase [Paracoccaceae bacterium]